MRFRSALYTGLCLLLLTACTPLTNYSLPVQVPPQNPSTETVITFHYVEGTMVVNSPSYRLVLYGDGTVTYEGQGTGVVNGKRTTIVDRVHVDSLLYEFGKLDFLNLDYHDELPPPKSGEEPLNYLFPLDDWPFHPLAMTVGLKIGDRHKVVLAHLPAAPEGMKALINQIHIETEAIQWVERIPYPTLTPGPTSPMPTPGSLLPSPTP